MPIDPKKFKKIVTNHFDNLSEEEFLKTLHKSSPYLFDENSEEKKDVKYDPLRSLSDVPSNRSKTIPVLKVIDRVQNNGHIVLQKSWENRGEIIVFFSFSLVFFIVIAIYNADIAININSIIRIIR
jgi:hypothetical protein